uniref:Uncharacterized protein n=1 Tax=Anguilla anguilla TaxID=7936 RepID=A0A0E9WP21_ANGAN
MKRPATTCSQRIYPVKLYSTQGIR